jgi:hypothetical protein
MPEILNKCEQHIKRLGVLFYIIIRRTMTIEGNTQLQTFSFMALYVYEGPHT